MRLLAIETATEACSAALVVDDAISERFRIAPREHTALILPMIDALLAEAELGITQLDGIAVGRGPGAFTGVRIAIGVAQGIAFGADLPVIPVSTLAALAQGAFASPRREAITPAAIESGILAAIDARMGEVYFSAFAIGDDGVVAALGSEQVNKPEAIIIPPGGPWRGIGTGWDAHGEALCQRLQQAPVTLDATALPHARDVAYIGARRWAEGMTVAPAKLAPVYLRDRVAEKPPTLPIRPG